MKKVQTPLACLLATAFLVACFFFIRRSSIASNHYKNEKHKIAEILNFNDRLLSVRDWIFTQEAWLEKKAAFEAVDQMASSYKQTAIQQGYFLLIASLVFLVIILLLFARSKPYFGATFGGIIVGIALLGYGCMNPMLEISVFKEDLTVKVYLKPQDIPYYKDAIVYMGKLSEITEYVRFVPFVGDGIADSAKELADEGQSYLKDNAHNEFGMDKVFDGKTFFYYQCKGIVDVISLLWTNNNKLVALAIAIFSLFIPLIKLFVSLFILLLPTRRNSKRLRKLLNYIAKWSMADVFVVAAFLAFLSFANMSPGVQIDAAVQFGLYYFGGYVLISIVLGYLLDRSIQEKQATLTA